MKTSAILLRNRAAALALLLTLLTGCVSEVVDKDRLMPALPPHREYPELTGYRLRLELTSPREYIAGTRDCRVVYSLENAGDAMLRIDEWYLQEAANLNVYCQPWFPGTEHPDDDLWLPVGSPVPANAARYPVELNPGNRMTLARELPFIEKLTVTPGAERRYFIKAELNLKSVKAASPVNYIVVRPPAPEKNFTGPL